MTLIYAFFYCRRISVGNFVAVKAGHSKWYTGQVLSIDEERGEVEIKFLKKVAGKILQWKLGQKRFDIITLSDKVIERKSTQYSFYHKYV